MRATTTLRRAEDFQKTQRHGRRVRHRGVTVVAAVTAPGEPARLGLVVPRGVGTAVVRNRLRRRLREAWRLLDVTGVDVVVHATTEARDMTFQELTEALKLGTRGRA
jgi:ribonuclease P protein component